MFGGSMIEYDGIQEKLRVHHNNNNWVNIHHN
jgi:hypothetical protein